MIERLTQDLTERARIIGAGLLDWLERQDTRLASALNPDEVDYPRIYGEPEAPCATEEELG